MPRRGPTSGLACTSRRKGGCVGRMLPMDVSFDAKSNRIVRWRKCATCGTKQRTTEAASGLPSENPPLAPAEVEELAAIEATIEEQHSTDIIRAALRDVIGDSLEIPVGEDPAVAHELELAELQSKLRERMAEEEA